MVSPNVFLDNLSIIGDLLMDLVISFQVTANHSQTYRSSSYYEGQYLLSKMRYIEAEAFVVDTSYNLRKLFSHSQTFWGLLVPDGIGRAILNVSNQDLTLV